MPNPDMTPDERAELQRWRNILDDRTRPPQDHDQAKAAIERLNIEGPWVAIRDLEARVAVIEAALVTRATGGVIKADKAREDGKITLPRKSPVKAKKATPAKPPTATKKTAPAKPPTVSDDLTF